MNRVLKTLGLIITVTTVAVLGACNPDSEGIDPEILAYIKKPCKSEIQASFHENESGWVLNVSCTDEAKLEQSQEKMFRGLERVEPRTDGFDPLKY